MSAPTTFAWPHGAKAAVSLTFDDGRASQIDVGLPILDAHGIQATFYVMPDAVEKKYAGWRKAVTSGHEIGNHTLHHPCSANFDWARNHASEDYTLERMEREILDANLRIEQILGVVPRTFAYPCGLTFIGRGRTHTSYVPLIAKHFLAGRGFLWETHAHPTGGDLGILPGFFSDDWTLDRYLARIETARAAGGWAIFCGHEVSPDSGYHNTRADALDALCAHLQRHRGELWTAPVAEIAAYIRSRTQP